MSEGARSEPGRTEETVYVLSPLNQSSSQDGREILIADLLAGIWRWRWIIGAVTIVGGLAGFGLAKMTPTTYEATATLLIQPPQFSSELTPAALSVDAYRTLLNADYTLGQVREALVEEGIFPQDIDILQLRGMVSTTIPQPEGLRYLQQNLPMIEIAAGVDTPEKAQGIANIYARVFVEMSREITTRGQEGALQLIESRYPASKKRLDEASVELKKRQDDHAQALHQLQRRWNDRISGFKTETAALVAAHQKETNQLLLGFDVTHKPYLLKAQLERGKRRLGILEEDRKDTRLEFKSATYQMAELKRMIEGQPELLSLSQAIPDGQWWSVLDPREIQSLTQRLQDLALQSETPNPTYINLMERLIEAQVKAETLGLRQQDLVDGINNVREEIKGLSDQIMKVQVDEFNLQQQRSLELTRLREQRALELSRLTSQRELKVGAFLRDENLDLSALTREQQTASATYGLIAQKYESVRLAKSEQETDVKIGALALRPEAPVSKYTQAKIAIGLLAAFLLAFFGAAVVVALSIPGAKRKLEAATGSQLTTEAPPSRRLVES